MRKIILGLAASAAIATPLGTAAHASVTIDSAGKGFVGKGDVQTALGYNNTQMQANAGEAHVHHDAGGQPGADHLPHPERHPVRLAVGCPVRRPDRHPAPLAEVDRDALLLQDQRRRRPADPHRLKTGERTAERTGTRSGTRFGTRDAERTGTRSGTKPGVLSGSLSSERRLRGPQVQPDHGLQPDRLKTGPDVRRPVGSPGASRRSASTPGSVPGRFGAPVFTDDFTFGEYGSFGPASFGPIVWDADWSTGGTNDDPDVCLKADGTLGNNIDPASLVHTFTDGPIVEGAIIDGAIFEGGVYVAGAPVPGAVTDGDIGVIYTDYTNGDDTVTPVGPVQVFVNGIAIN